MTWASHEASLVVFLSALALISLSNLVGMHRLRCARRKSPQGMHGLPRVSILVPARNEEANIEACAASLLAQDYPDFEVLVLDDASEDRTAEKLEPLSSDGRLLIFTGAPLPAGWLGKNWACHQLANAATGEVLLFTDADTRHHPRALGDAVASLSREQVGFLSVLPEQELRTWGERLVVPILPWSQHTFYPIALLRKARRPAFTTAIGQYMLFRRSVYDAIGGFERVRDSIIDDCDLVRAVARAGHRWTFLDGTGRITTRMYSSFTGVAAGFAKNLFARFGYNFPLFAFVWTWLLWVTWQPPLLLIVWALAPSEVPYAAIPYAAAATGLNLLTWFISDARTRVRLDHVALAPLTVLLAFAIAVRSVVWHVLRRGTWKKRAIRP